MGHNDSGVSFAEAAPGDVSLHDVTLHDERSPFAVRQDALGMMIDDIVQEDFMNGRVLARRAERIERARFFTEQTARDLVSTTSLAARLDMAERSLAAELGGHAHPGSHCSKPHRNQSRSREPTRGDARCSR